MNGPATVNLVGITGIARRLVQEGQPGLGGHIGERAIGLIAIQADPAKARHEQIVAAVAVVVQHAGAVRVERIVRQLDLGGHIHKPPATVVAVQGSAAAANAVPGIHENQIARTPSVYAATATVP